MLQSLSSADLFLPNFIYDPSSRHVWEEPLSQIFDFLCQIIFFKYAKQNRFLQDLSQTKLKSKLK